MADPHERARAATVVHADPLAPAVEFFTALGFRIERVFPADDPRSVSVVGFGTRLKLERGRGDPVRLEVADPSLDAPTEDIAPGGHVVRRVPVPAAVDVPRCRGRSS